MRKHNHGQTAKPSVFMSAGFVHSGEFTCRTKRKPWLIKRVRGKFIFYRQEVSELAVEQLLQLALVEFVFVAVVSRVVVENRDQRVHGALELARHPTPGGEILPEGGIEERQTHTPKQMSGFQEKDSCKSEGRATLT